MVEHAGFAKGQCVCRACYKRFYYKKKPCLDCGTSISLAADRCHRCEGVNRRGSAHYKWAGGRSIRPGGYVMLSGHHGHPNAGVRGHILEHVKVMSEILGRPLHPGENVHHINGIRDDNRPENLELWNISQPSGQRIEDKVAWAKEILATYEPSALM